MTRRTGLVGGMLALLSGCSATGALNALAGDASYERRADLKYGQEARQTLDVYLPRGGPSSGRALLVFFYGGSWSRGSKDDYRFAGEAFASAGIVTVIADYRLSPGVRYPVFVEDSARATAWAMAQAGDWGVDPARIFVGGHSSGAYQAAMVALDARWLRPWGTSPARLAGFIGLAGPYDFLPIENPDAQVAFEWPHTSPDSQPIHHASAGAPPTLLIAANSDSLVNPDRNTDGLAAALRAQGVPVVVHRHGGVNHMTLMGAVARPLRWLAPVRQEMVDFIARPPLRSGLPARPAG